MKLSTKHVLFASCITITAALIISNLLSDPQPARAFKQSATLAGSPGSTQTSKPDVHISIAEITALGFDKPVHLTHAGDGTGRLFVVEQTGKIKVIKNGAVLAAPFVDLGGEIALDYLEQGLLGMAFHPEYAANGYFYVSYIRKGDYATVVSRCTVSITDDDKGDCSTELQVLVIDQYTRLHHYGGTINFGPNDGYLYISLGDGGPQGDPNDRGQDTGTLLGKILRIDVDSGFPYGIPADNPFVGEDGLDEIWLYGFRNPWRFSFDRENGDLYIADVGHRTWEEIDYLAAGSPAGVNYGWRCKEGAHDYNYTGDCLSRVLVDPIAEYERSTSGGAVTGGFVYRGTDFPRLSGRFFYADFNTGRIWSLYKQNSDPDSWSIPELELDSDLQISAIGEGEDGELYVLDWGAGRIHRLADGSETTPNLSSSQKQGSSPSANPGETVTYSISIRNTGLVTDTAVNLVDTVPPGLEYIPASM